MTYITVKEASEKWNISERRICILCKEGRIRGAEKKSRVWMIPETAQKPEDGRRNEIRRGIEPSCLIYNPTYFASKSTEPTRMEKSICDIQEMYLQGHLAEAYDEMEHLLKNMDDDRYLCPCLFIKMIICIDLGKREEFRESENGLQSGILSGKSDCLDRFLAYLYTGMEELNDDFILEEEQYERIMPLLSLISAKRSINSILKIGGRADVSGLEIVCHELDKKDSPLIGGYYHLYLAVYYNIVNVQHMFSYHFEKALAILLPRKWYTPIAEFSASIDLSILEKIDPAAYKTVLGLSDFIIASFVNIGIFDEFVDMPGPRNAIVIRIGYKLVQGKSIEVIARELEISQYKVKQYMEELYAFTGVQTKRELRELIMRNIFI